MCEESQSQTPERADPNHQPENEKSIGILWPASKEIVAWRSCGYASLENRPESEEHVVSKLIRLVKISRACFHFSSGSSGLCMS